MTHDVTLIPGGGIPPETPADMEEDGAATGAQLR